MAVETEVGTIWGRDSIFLDKLIQSDCPSTVKIFGEISVQLCSNYKGPPGKWVSYELIFNNTLAFVGWEVEAYPHGLEKISSIDRIEDSEWAKDLHCSEQTHYVLSTYDYIYEILAQDFVLTLGLARE